MDQLGVVRLSEKDVSWEHAIAPGEVVRLVWLEAGKLKFFIGLHADKTKVGDIFYVRNGEGQAGMSMAIAGPQLPGIAISSGASFRFEARRDGTQGRLVKLHAN